MKARFKFMSAVFVLALLIPPIAFPWSGKCVGISDGYTIAVMHEGKAERIRLYGIDCPERKQRYSKKAKEFTSKMVFGEMVEVKPVTKDRYRRTVAWVYVDGACLNKELLRAGFAWHYKRYSQDRELAELEGEARAKGIGLWRDPHPIPPWECRRIRRR